ncbi:MAG: LytR C-terminal domain-containing protein [Candidatus Falkowbacteria bacterium]
MNKLKLTTSLGFILLIFVFCGTVQAQDLGNLTLSITPPLIKNNVSPGQVWRTAVKVVNNNSVPMDIYTEVVDFRSGDETGKVEFIRDQGQLDLYRDHLLSQWIDMDAGPHPIAPGQSLDIPFTITVPDSAGPGGHYAAILAGTKPPEKTSGGSSIKVSSQLASLILLRINGEEKEEGSIREFSAAKSVYFQPRVDFKIRFQNTGNVHLLPRGEIGVYDMFGSEKGNIKLNENTEFGNVLPESIRTWNFEWTGEKRLTAMGRYRATLILSYGDRASETLDHTLYFWVVYPKILLITLGSISLFVLLLIFFIRRYIRKSILATQAQLGIANTGIKGIPARTAAGTTVVKTDKLNWTNFKKLIIGISVFTILAIGLSFYWYFNGDSESRITETLNEEPAPEEGANGRVAPDEAAVEIIESGAVNEIPMPAEPENIEALPAPAAPADLSVKALNGSGLPGLAGAVAKKLEGGGYEVRETGNADNFDYSNLTIRHKPGLKAEAEALGKIFKTPATLTEGENMDVDLIVIAGKGYED